MAPPRRQHVAQYCPLLTAHRGHHPPLLPCRTSSAAPGASRSDRRQAASRRAALAPWWSGGRWEPQGSGGVAAILAEQRWDSGVWVRSVLPCLDLSVRRPQRAFRRRSSASPQRTLPILPPSPRPLDSPPARPLGRPSNSRVHTSTAHGARPTAHSRAGPPSRRRSQARGATVDVRRRPPEHLSSSRRAMKGYSHLPEPAEPCRWATFRRSSRSRTGTVAVLYVGMECGVERIRGCSHWKNALIGGVVSGALISAASNNHRDKIVKDAITGGAISG